MGILLAFVAMLSWGVGDFLIQKSTRQLGTPFKRFRAFLTRNNDEKYSTWIVLFYICGFGTLVLTPFVWQEIGLLSIREIGFLFLVGVVMLGAALLDFKALKIGKISVVEQVLVLEISAVLILTSLLLGEVLNIKQYFLIVILMVGIIFISIKDFGRLKKFVLEQGVVLAGAAAITMGVADFLVGFGSRTTSPLMTNWFLNAVITIATLGYLIFDKKWDATWHYARDNRKLIFYTCFFDNLAWVAYASSMALIPIAIATAISESYIVLAVVLGFWFNKEKLKTHQWAGLILIVTAALTLGLITK